jgi:hypothetical protein
MRVGQLDAELLDQELASMLKEPVNKALGQLGVSSGSAAHDPSMEDLNAHHAHSPQVCTRNAL